MMRMNILCAPVRRPSARGNGRHGADWATRLDSKFNAIRRFLVGDRA
jgi:hypothetical protein